MRVKTMLVGSNQECLTELREFISFADNYRIIGERINSGTAFSELPYMRPDLLIVNLAANNPDGFPALNSAAKGQTKVIVLSPFGNESFCARILSLGADRHLVKPVSSLDIKNCADEVTISKTNCPDSAKKHHHDDKLEEEITRILISAWIPPNLQGFRFLREAVKKAVEFPEILNNLSKRLYPDLADQFGTSSSSVEASIRHAIEVAWNRGANELFNSLFGVCIYHPDQRITSGEFIALIADRMILDRVI